MPLLIRRGLVDLADAAQRMPWRDALADPAGGGMPPHQYFVIGANTSPRLSVATRRDVDTLLSAIERHPASYDAYFRGYRYPMRYLELPDQHRYWRTVLRKTHMLNRCHLDSVEPPRRVSEGAKPMHLEWHGPPWAAFGSPWPVGYRPDGRGGYIHDIDADWKMRYVCTRCGVKYMPIPDDRPCPGCRFTMTAAAGDMRGSRPSP